jgi:anti-sigma factor RsiW
MNKLPPLADDGHVEALIPWYVNGTLGVSDTQQVQRHIQSCEQCRASVELERKIATLVLEHRDTLDCAPQSGWTHIAAQLDARTPLLRKPSVRRLRQRVSGKRMVRTLLILQAAAIAGLGIAVVQLLNTGPEESYRTLSDVAPAPAASATTLRVVFNGATTSDDIRTLLEPIGGTIRSGPTANGVYTIEAQKAGSAAALDWLRSRQQVLFAEPVGAPRDD